MDRLDRLSRERALIKLFGSDFRNRLRSRELTSFTIVQRLREKPYKNATIVHFLNMLRKEKLIRQTNAELGVRRERKKHRVRLEADAIAASNFEKLVHYILDALVEPVTTRARYETALIVLLLYFDPAIKPMEIGVRELDEQLSLIPAFQKSVSEPRIFVLSPHTKERAGFLIRSTHDTINKSLVQSYVNACFSTVPRSLGLRYLMNSSHTLRNSVKTWVGFETYVNTA